MTPRDFSVRGQRVLVVGAARSGVAAALLLARRGAAVTLTDRKEAIADASVLHQAGVALELGGHRAETFERADLVVTSPGVALELPEVARARAAGVPVVGELELASRWLRGPVVAITGAREVHDDHAGGPHARGRRAARAGGRQHRRAAQRAGGQLDH
jgi:UDP-N-acetylmuramoylalanine--D-glutamate ligase